MERERPHNPIDDLEPDDAVPEGTQPDLEDDLPDRETDHVVEERANETDD